MADSSRRKPALQISARTTHPESGAHGADPITSASKPRTTTTTLSQRAPPASTAPRRPVVRRKPVSGSGSSGQVQTPSSTHPPPRPPPRPPPAPPLRPPDLTSHTTNTRLPPTTTPPMSPSSPPDPESTSHRSPVARPLGPRPLPPTPPQTVPDHHPPALPTRPSLASTPHSLPHRLQTPVPPPSLQPPTPQASLTLIRRDPSRALQQNVAILPGLGSWRLSGRVRVQVLTPGYAAVAPSFGSGVRASPSGEGFWRELHLGGAGRGEQRHRVLGRVRGLRSSRDEDWEAGPAEEPGTRGTREDFSFESAWGGQCVFVGGLTGRGLKCLHHPPYHSYHSQHQLHNGRDAEAVEVVSELRLNIQKGAKQSGSGHGPRPARPPRWTHNSSATTTTTTTGSFTSTASPTSKRASTASSWGRSKSKILAADSTASGLDMGLAHEELGGGLRGDKTKLGKIIVEPEGLKMLDLLVAANVGLWWLASDADA